MMKRILILSMIMACMFFGCAESTDSESVTQEEETYYMDYKYNNDVPLEKCTPVAYSLVDLYNYFGTISLVELHTSYQEYPPEQYIHTIDEVNAHFPITNLRLMVDTSPQHFKTTYSVYRTVEGGYFYVIWSFYWAEKPSPTIPSNVPVAARIAYFDKDYGDYDFSSLVVGASTAEDVARIDPNICIYYGGFIYSQTYINLYDIVSIVYTLDMENRIDDGITQRQELKVDAINVLSGTNRNGTPVGDFLGIREEDLP